MRTAKNSRPVSDQARPTGLDLHHMSQVRSEDLGREGTPQEDPAQTRARARDPTRGKNLRHVQARTQVVEVRPAEEGSARIDRELSGVPECAVPRDPRSREEPAIRPRTHLRVLSEDLHLEPQAVGVLLTVVPTESDLLPRPGEVHPEGPVLGAGEPRRPSRPSRHEVQSTPARTIGRDLHGIGLAQTRTSTRGAMRVLPHFGRRPHDRPRRADFQRWDQLHRQHLARMSRL